MARNVDSSEMPDKSLLSRSALCTRGFASLGGDGTDFILHEHLVNVSCECLIHRLFQILKNKVIFVYLRNLSQWNSFLRNLNEFSIFRYFVETYYVGTQYVGTFGLVILSKFL